MKRMWIVWVVGWVVPASAAASDVPVRVYADGNHSSLTDLFQGVDKSDAPLAGAPVTLLRAGEVREVQTDAGGHAVFDGAGDGLYLLRPRVEGDPECTSRNVARHLADLLESDARNVIYVALGDSTPVYGAARPYPARLGDKVKTLFPLAETHNLAREGSTTWDWLPGHWAFEGARSWIGLADLITVSLGGNDLQALAGLDFTDLTAALAAAQQIIAQTLDNAALIVDAIRDENPGADIVWTIYPNYARSKKWLEYVPQAYIGMLQSGLEVAIGQMRDGLSENPGLLIADVYEEWADEDIEPYLFDPIHVNDAGAESYAKVIFRTLGGVLLPEDDGRERLFGFALAPQPEDAAGPEARPEDAATPELAAPEDAGGADFGVDDGPVQGETTAPDSGGAGDHATETDAWAASDEASDVIPGDLGSPDRGPGLEGLVPASGSSSGGCRTTRSPGWPAWLFAFLLPGLGRRRPEPTGRIELPTR